MHIKKIQTWIEQRLDELKAMLQDEDEIEKEENDRQSAEDRDYPSFEKELPYEYYDEKTNIFFNEYNAGLLYQVIPITGANEKIAEQLDAILREKISHDLTLQVILIKHNQVGHDIDLFSAQFSQEDIGGLKVLGDNLNQFYKKAAVDGFNNRANRQMRLTHTDCYIVVDKKTKGSEKETENFLGQFRVGFEAALMATKIGFKRCDASDFLTMLAFYFQHDTDNIYQKSFSYDKKRWLKNQVLGSSFDLTLKYNSILFHNVDSKAKAYDTEISVLTIDKLPDDYKIWENINNTNNIFSPQKNIACNHIISVTYVVEEQAKAETKANRKTADLDKKAKSSYALQVAGTEKKAKEWRAFREELSTQKTRSVKMLYNVVLFSKPEKTAYHLETAINTFSYNKIQLGLCRRMQLPYFLNTLPFLFTGRLDKGFSIPTMMWPISSWNATQYIPILSDWCGVGKGILMPTSRDQFACIDPFSSILGTNYNIAVTGTSGSGKSFFIQMLLLNVLFNHGDVFIIDIGGSYRKLCEILGGTYLEYHHLAMNPFTHVSDITAEIDDIISLFEHLSCPTKGASDDDRGTLREAILLAYSTYKNETIIDNVQASLLSLYESDEKTYPSANILAKNLTRYCMHSEHGKVFNMPSQLSPHARLIVVDLKEIEDNASIRAPVLLSVISQFQRRMFNSDRNRQKMCIIDEAWSFFTGDPMASNFITKGFRTGRRHKSSFVTITQGIDDYYDFSEARAAWDNSSLKLIFLQDQKAFLEHQKQHETFSDYEASVIKNFPLAKDANFSEVLIKGNGISSFHRLFVDDFTRVLLSSDGDDYQAVKNLVDSGISYLDAVQLVSKKIIR